MVDDTDETLPDVTDIVTDDVIGEVQLLPEASSEEPVAKHIKREPGLDDDDDCLIIGESATPYSGPRIMSDVVKMEMEADRHRIEYNEKNPDKMIPAPPRDARFDHCHDIRLYYPPEQIAMLLLGPHGKMYRENFKRLDNLKKQLVC